ncbi:uncharacterized protein MYCFIDRAFT_62882 [Pseudocercospora fijiensis CIRAD86]|uniref:Acyl-protein thioesterase 1 n=1 Tax=Pseudocercospora fijiensis (strain CIRAD86) TaxID=383855 RepID=N1Q871_PSEFD|nr:uncharacterized protein MYCFIDRAFT_62882 [Pseudocercospora fijiensis CIRAD86]EME89050.1 hypothetical protein MYCFIDRAFT_62882 [Pseudocercospora fijiensis CIRAD86]
MSAAKALVVEAVKRHTSTVIVAHGLGDSYSLAEEFRRKSLFPETKFVFPNAPNIPITVNGGMAMPGWYDIADFGDLANRNEDEAGILRSQKVFHTLIEDEIKAGIPTERIVLGGFSQGGAMSLMAGITSPTKLGGIFGLSCYLLLQGKVRELVPKDSPNQQTPIFMGHGDADPVVRYAWGKATADKLKEWGWNVDFRTYKNLPHSAAPQEIEDLAQYLQKQIPDLGDKAAGGSL